MVTSNHVYADELTVHGEHDVKTWMQQDKVVYAAVLL
jgi:hypothetical protein